MYSVIDIEGNGAAYRKESIIEVAVFRFDGHKIVDQFISLINPDSDITPYVQKLTGITPKMVRTAPRFHEVAKRIIEITENSTLVGHNVDFDYRMLRQEFKRLGYEYKINTLDTIPLAQKLLPDAQSYSLGKLVKSLGIPHQAEHRAAGDARATLDLLKLLMIKDENSEIIQQQYHETNAKTYVNKVRYLTQDLPGDAGIIYFQNSKGKILYHTFVNDVVKFARSVFNAKLKRWEKVQQETELITYEPAGHAFLAKVLMHSKGLGMEETLPYGLFFRGGQWSVEKLNAKSGEPFLKFSSFTQGQKAKRHIKNSDRFAEPAALKQLLALKNRDELWLMAGRTLGEKAFLTVEGGKLTAFGFFEIHTQINSRKKIDAIKVPLKGATSHLKNDVALSLLRGDFEIHTLPA